MSQKRPKLDLMPAATGRVPELQLLCKCKVSLPSPPSPGAWHGSRVVAVQARATVDI